MTSKAKSAENRGKCPLLRHKAQMQIDETADNDNCFGCSDVEVNWCLVATRVGDVGDSHYKPESYEEYNT